MDDSKPPPEYEEHAKSKIVYPKMSMPSKSKISMDDLSPEIIEQLKKQLAIDMKKAEEEKQAKRDIWATPEMRLENILKMDSVVDERDLHGHGSPGTSSTDNYIQFKNTSKELIPSKTKKTNYEPPFMRFYNFISADEYNKKTNGALMIEPIYSIDCDEEIPNDQRALGIIISAICDIFDDYYANQKLYISGTSMDTKCVIQCDKYWKFIIEQRYSFYQHPFHYNNSFSSYDTEFDKYVQYNNIYVITGDTGKPDLMYVSYDIMDYNYVKMNVSGKIKAGYQLDEKSKRTVIEPFTTHNQLIGILSKWKPKLAPHILI